MEEQNQQQLTPRPEKPKKKYYEIWWVWVIILMMLASGYGAYIMYLNNTFRVFSDRLDYTPSTCNRTMECNADTPEECVENWLVSSGCLSQEYIDKHYSNFRIESEYNFDLTNIINTQQYDGSILEVINQNILLAAKANDFNQDDVIQEIQNASKMFSVEFDYEINGEDPCNKDWQCRAEVLEANDNFYLYHFSGPLREYQSNYSCGELSSKYKQKLTKHFSSDLILDVSDIFYYGVYAETTIDFSARGGLYCYARIVSDVGGGEWFIRPDTGQAYKYEYDGLK